MERYAWKATVLPGKLDEYVRRHNAIWPELKEVLHQAGIRNYTIWNVGNELFGYYECDSIVEAARVQAESPVVDRWNEYMKDVMLMEMDPETGAQPLMKQVFFFDEISREDRHSIRDKVAGAIPPPVFIYRTVGGIHQIPAPHGVIEKGGRIGTGIFFQEMHQDSEKTGWAFCKPFIIEIQLYPIGNRRAIIFQPFLRNIGAERLHLIGRQAVLIALKRPGQLLNGDA